MWSLCTRYNGNSGPMAKRHPSLISLSHDHHHGLALALRLRQGASALLNDGWTHDRREQARRVLRFHQEELSVHFRLEEEILFPAMMKHVSHVSSLITDLIAQHRQMERLIARLQGSEPAPLDQILIDLGEILEQHIRSEERDLFPTYERDMPPQVTGEILKLLQQRQNEPS
jgi:iron-sulfur cluster repair protein YtfE (RIC family)